MKKIVLIGGGEIGRGNTSYETKEIDEEIVKLSNKDNPTLLFIGLASSYSDSYYDTIKKIYKNLGCETVYLKKKNIINNPDIVINKINNSDIIYIGGGDSIKLIEDIKEYNIDKLLENALNKGTILVGYSAGAILLSNLGFSDSYILRNESNEYKFIQGLNYTNINICPHYDTSIDKQNSLEKEIIKRKIEVYALENNTALKIIDNNISKINTNKKIYIINYKTKKELK